MNVKKNSFQMDLKSMQNFKQFLLKEDNSAHYPWQVTTNEELEKLYWDKDELSKTYSHYDRNTGEVYLRGYMENGEFNMVGDWPYIDDSLLVKYQGQFYLPFQIHKWHNPTRDGDFTLTNSKLTSLIGLPNEIQGSFSIENCENIKNVEGCPSIIKGLLFNWIDMPITNNIHKTVKEVKKIILPFEYMGFLSFLHIKNLQNVVKSFGSTKLKYKNYHDKEQAIEIVNNHLLEDRDILECQEELITKGLKAYAKL